MPVKYKIVSCFRPGKGKKGEKLWFPKLTGSSRANQEEIEKILELRSTASGGDVELVIRSLVDLIPELLLSNRTVRLDGLGTFRLHAKVKSSDSPETVRAKNIEELRISFIPDKKIKDKLKNAAFVFDDSVK